MWFIVKFYAFVCYFSHQNFIIVGILIRIYCCNINAEEVAGAILAKGRKCFF